MKKLVAAVAVIVLAIGVYLWTTQWGKKGSAEQYVTLPVEHGTLKIEVSCSGPLQPLNLVEVGSQVSGGIKDVLVDVESRVTKGQLLALIDTAPFEAKHVQAKASHEGSKASLFKAEAAFAEAHRNWRRKKALLADSAIPEHEYDTAKTQLDQAQAEVDIQKTRIVETEGKIQEAEIELKNCRIESPLNGVVILRKAEAGQTLAATYQTPMLFKVAEDLRKMRIEANVDEADIGLVKVGQSARFRVPAFPREDFTGLVKEILSEPKVKNNVVTYTVYVDFDNYTLLLRPGMTANVTIIVGEVQDALIVPEQALHFSPQETTATRGQPVPPAPKAGEGTVWKLTENGEIKPIKVKIGMTGMDKVQVFSDELKAGDNAVVEYTPEKK